MGEYQHKFFLLKTTEKLFAGLRCPFKKKKRLKNFMSRNSIEVTCLNGESLGSLENQDNPVLNRMFEVFPALPGLYMIHCLKNDWRYYGETSNLQARKSSHKSKLHRRIHENFDLQKDYNSFGSNVFQYTILHIGTEWQNAALRKKKELDYIVLNQTLAYNIYFDNREGQMNPFWGRMHSEEAKQAMSDSRKGTPNDQLGRTIFIPSNQSNRRGDNGRFVQGGKFPSIAEASRQTGFSRKLIRERLLSSDFPDWKEIENNL